MSAPTYIPRPGSLAASVVYFFRTNADEELTLDDIVDKFGSVRGNIHTQLRPALDVDLLRRDTNADGEYIYQAGARIEVIPQASEPARPKARKPASFDSPRHEVDFDALKVDKGVPLRVIGPYGAKPLKWDPLFEKLAEVGDSIQLPAKLRATLSSAVIARNKKGRGHFRVLMTGADTCRVWRVDPPAQEGAKP